MVFNQQKNIVGLKFRRNEVKLIYRQSQVIFYRFADFLQLSEVENVHQYKTTLLFVSLTAYFVKTQINPQTKSLIQKQVAQVLKLEYFLKLQAQYQKLFQSSLDSITLTQHNQTYEALLIKQIEYDSGKNIRQVDDYNQIVDAILDMAPPYQKDESDIPQKKVTRMKNKSGKNTKQLKNIKIEKGIKKLEEKNKQNNSQVKAVETKFEYQPSPQINQFDIYQFINSNPFHELCVRTHLSSRLSDQNSMNFQRR